MMMRLISLFLFCLAPAQVQAFGTAPARVPATSTNTRRASFAPRTGTGVSLKIAIQLQLQQSPTQLWSQPEEKEEDAVEVEVNPRLEGTQYPIDIASPILLATSMILAILCTGSLFQLLEGKPPAGIAGTLAIMGLGYPACFYLFYAAIKKGTAETEQDDKEYLASRRGR